MDEIAAPDADVMACATPGSALHAFLHGVLKSRPQSLLTAQRERRVQATGTSDDIGMAAPDRQTAQDLVAWAHAIAPLVGYTRAPDKDQFGQILTYTGLHVNLTDAPLASARAHKIHATYADFASNLLGRRDEPGPVTLKLQLPTNPALPPAHAAAPAVHASEESALALGSQL